MHGYHHSDGYCYFTPYKCSTNYINCQCYASSSMSYTNATCINVNGAYQNGICYYSESCPYYSFNEQCYNSRRKPGYYGQCGLEAYDGQYCYYNSFQ